MLTLQIGQCGNQLGHSLYSKLSFDMDSMDSNVSQKSTSIYLDRAFERWFGKVTKDNKRVARAILLDTERKVVNKIFQQSSDSWNYSSKNVICQADGGASNNWTYGYAIKGQQLHDTTSNTIRQEIETMDRFESFFSLLSSSGGTGSGVGTRLIEHLRDEYPTKSIFSTIVLPFSFGEVSTQNFNTLLTLSKLYNSIDMIILFENEQIHRICMSLLKKTHTTFQDLNDIITDKLCATMQPTNDANYSMTSFISDVASHPSYKYAVIKSTPHIPVESLDYETFSKWNLYIRHLKETLRVPSLNNSLRDNEIKIPTFSARNTKSREYCCSVSNVLITRGSNQKDNLVCKDLEEKSLYANWVTFDWFKHKHHERRIFQRDKFLTLVSNNSQIYQPLEKILEKSWTCYTHAAFLHVYKEFGFEDDDFLEAFARLENIVKEYKELKS